MKRGLPLFLRTTLVGGIIFLLPLLLVAFVAQQGFQLASKLAKPVVELLPDTINSRVDAPALVALLALLTLAFTAGLFARTRTGQSTMQWFENSLIGTLPQFNFVRGIAESVDGDDRHVEVVLVPTDAGLCFGFVFKPSAESWVPVFIPGAPEWTSGSVAFVQAETIRKTDLSFLQAMTILKRLGENADQVIDGLKAGNN